VECGRLFQKTASTINTQLTMSERDNARRKSLRTKEKDTESNASKAVVGQSGSSKIKKKLETILSDDQSVNSVLTGKSVKYIFIATFN
jgi:hypothetical protein